MKKFYNNHNIFQILLFLFVFILSSTFYLGCASSKPASQNQMLHEFVKDYPNTSKDQIFDRSMRWISQNFKSAKSVIDYQDKTAGTIIAKGILPNIDFGGLHNANLGFTLTLDIKDNKARFNYNNLVPINPSSGEELNDMSNFERVQVKADKEFVKMTDEMSKAILINSDF